MLLNPDSHEAIIERAEGRSRVVAGNLGVQAHNANTNTQDLDTLFRFFNRSSFFSEELGLLRPIDGVDPAVSSILNHEGDGPGIVLGLGKLLERFGLIGQLPSVEDSLTVDPRDAQLAERLFDGGQSG